MRVPDAPWFSIYGSAQLFLQHPISVMKLEIVFFAKLTGFLMLLCPLDGSQVHELVFAILSRGGGVGPSLWQDLRTPYRRYSV